MSQSAPVRKTPALKIADTVDSEDLIHPSDFNSLRTEILIDNTTTRTHVKDRQAARLTQLLEHGMVLEVPSKSCAQGHSLVLAVISARSDGSLFEFVSTARVEDLRSLAGGRDQIAITLLQYEESQWEALRQLYSTRQQEILRFLKTARGG